MDEGDQYWKRPIASTAFSGNRAVTMATSPAQAARDRSIWINQRARMVFGAYRRDDFADPDSFLVQLGMVLERYSDKIIEEVTDPRTGIQRHCTFPPSIAEFSQFCEDIERRRSFKSTWDKRSAEQLIEREQFERDNREPLEHRQKVVKRIIAELGEKGFKFKGGEHGSSENPQAAGAGHPEIPAGEGPASPTTA